MEYALAQQNRPAARNSGALLYHPSEIKMYDVEKEGEGGRGRSILKKVEVEFEEVEWREIE